MKHARLHGLALATAGCAILLSTHSAADETGTSIRFAAPKRIHAGDAFLGEGRLFPSPVLRDMNGDGRPDIVIGDLFGRVTVAHGTPAAAFATEAKLNDRSGKPLKFSNW